MKNLQTKLKELSEEINKLDSAEVSDWINENILEITSNKNELLYTIGGPSISIYIDSGLIVGRTFSKLLVEEYSSYIFKDFFAEY